MPSKISLFNKEHIFQIFRSVGWLSVIQFLLLLFALPLNILMMITNEQNRIITTVENLFRLHLEIQVVTLIGIPVLLAVFLFRFLQVKDSVDFMHGLPIKRGGLFHLYTVTGIVLLLTPVLATSILMFVLHSTLDLSSYFSMTDILIWAGVTSLLELTLFMAGVFVGMFTGLSAVHAVLSYIFLLFPAGIFILVVYNLKFMFFGFPYDYFLNRKLERISPVTYAGVIDEQLLTPPYIIIYIILTIVLYFLSLMVYKKRKTETVSQPIVFSKLKSIFKYGTAFCVMLLGGTYFGEAQSQLSWMIFGYVAGSLVGYFAAEMVLRKTWRVFGQIKGYIAFAAVMMAIILFSQFGLAHYETKVPEINEIEKVHFTDSPYLYLNGTEWNLTFSVKELENVEAVQSLHKEIIEEKKEKQTLVNGWRDFMIAYELKNGEQIIRQYRINQQDYEDSLKRIYESEEYKRSSNELFQVKEQNVNRISIVAQSSASKKVTISDAKDIAEVINVLREDVLKETYEDYQNPRGNLSTIEIWVSDNRGINIEFKASYANIENWLEQKGLLSQSTIKADEIDYVLVAKKDKRLNDPNMAILFEEMFKEMEKSGQVIKITDKKQIDQFLDNSSSDLEKEYVSAFYLKNVEYPTFRGFDEKYLPEFVKGTLR